MGSLCTRKWRENLENLELNSIFVQSWTIQTGTEYIGSHSSFTNMCSLFCVKFVTVGSRLRCLFLTEILYVQGNEYMWVKNELEPTYFVPV